MLNHLYLFNAPTETKHSFFSTQKEQLIFLAFLPTFFTAFSPSSPFSFSFSFSFSFYENAKKPRLSFLSTNRKTLLFLYMAHINNNNSTYKANADNTNAANGELKNTPFHDFLGSSKSQRQDTSDLATERNFGDQLEGIPLYGSRGDITGASSKLVGNKRSTSGSLMGPSRDQILHGQPDSQDRLLSKLLRYSGLDQSRRQTSSHFMTDAGNDANASKWGRAIPPVNLGPSLKYPAPSGQLSPFGYQASNRFKDTNVGPPIMSQKAADEGSRTGIKGVDVLGSMKPSAVRQPSGVLMHRASKPGSESTSSQMTIFYGGQAHVFDSVHRSKADMIMSLAGSNGVSWSTSSNPPDSAAKVPSTVERRIPSGESDALLTRWKPLGK